MGDPKIAHNLFISIHAPARGATLSLMSRLPSSLYFNPRSREGSDSPWFATLSGQFISIHAPARGATHCEQTHDGLTYNFNPRSREGSDLLMSLQVSSLRVFQSTLPRGERHFYTAITGLNSTFQSTLPRGERQIKLQGSRALRNFNPRSREGSDSGDGEGARPPVNFNPRSREGSDSPLSASFNSSTVFQSTLPRGERPLKTVTGMSRILQFQSTLPRGERPSAGLL